MRHQPNYCTFYIVRHGETEGNVAMALIGQSNSKLTKKGKQQAKELTEKLKHIHFDAIFSSDLERVVKTLEGLALERKLVIQTTKALREKAYGSYEGRDRLEVNQELKHLFEVWKKLSQEERMKFKIYHDGESNGEAIDRFMLHLRELAVAYPNKTLLIGSHGGIMRYFIIKLGLATYDNLDTHAIKNAAYLKVKCDGTDFIFEEASNIDLPKKETS